MTYVELIIVLSIFSIISSTVIFNYGDFQAKVDIKNLASDIALQVVGAQKSALSGLLPPAAQQALEVPNWKPAYGVYFEMSDNKNFLYFTDLDQNNNFTDIACSGGDECLNKISITKNDFISNLDVFYQDSSTASLNDLMITFTRPNSTPVIASSVGLGPNISYVQVTISSPKNITGVIKLYQSGRIQIN